MQEDAIDAVVTWVDGSDPAHARKRAAALARRRRFSLTSIPGGRDRTRFADSGEIRYCLHAIRKHCPWIRTIFLVTDDQVPDFLDQAMARALGVRVVDHREIFRGHESALPTFNSQSIETALHRIPGLADRFVYFNDDVIVLKPTDAAEFFSANGVVLRGEWKPLPRFGVLRMAASSAMNHLADKALGKVRSMAMLAQYRAAQLAGFRDRFFEAPHTPHPLRTRTLRDFFQAHPDAFARNIGFPFRDMQQFVPVPLANHLELGAGRVVESASKDYLLICFNREAPAAIDAKIAALEQVTPRFLCVQGLERADAGRRGRLRQLLAGVELELA